MLSLDELIGEADRNPRQPARQMPRPSSGFAATRSSGTASPSPTSRDQTDEEAEIEKRYAEASREAKERELERLQPELGVVCYAAPGKRGKLRIVA